jgi:hypothetical protein
VLIEIFGYMSNATGYWVVLKMVQHVFGKLDGGFPRSVSVICHVVFGVKTWCAPKILTILLLMSKNLYSFVTPAAGIHS